MISIILRFLLQTGRNVAGSSCLESASIVIFSRLSQQCYDHAFSAKSRDPVNEDFTILDWFFNLSL